MSEVFLYCVSFSIFPFAWPFILNRRMYFVEGKFVRCTLSWDDPLVLMEETQNADLSGDVVSSASSTV